MGRFSTLGTGVAPTASRVMVYVWTSNDVKSTVLVHVFVSLIVDVVSSFAVAHAVLPFVVYGRVPFQT